MIKIVEFKKCSKSISEITSLIPKIQRPKDEEHVNEIYEYQLKCYSQNNMYIINSTISIVDVLETNSSFIIDGQHRLEAYKRLISDHPDRGISVSTDEYTVNKEEDIDYVYKMVNTHKPNDITKLGIDEYKIIQEVERYFKDYFYEYLSNSSKPYRPNINIEAIKNQIKEKNVISKCSINSGSEFVELIQKINKFYCDRKKEEFKHWHIKLEALEKINKFNARLFLGLYSNYEWLDRLIEHVSNNIPLEKLNHYDSSYRPKITRELRKIVWDSELLKINCYCCKDQIEFDNFECGHIIPLSMGGPTNKNNLKPICRNCNQDMKTMNMEEYKKLIQ